MKEIRVRILETKDQKESFRIWHAGMVEVGEEFIQVILNTTAMKYTFAILILIPILSRSYSTNIAFKTVAAFLPIILFFGLKTLIRKNIMGGYIKSRKDMKDIKNVYGDQFLVAEMIEDGVNKGIVGTIGYRESDEPARLHGKTLESPIWHIYSVSVIPGARRLGVAKKLMNEVHKIADKAKMDIYLTTSQAQPAAAALYRKLNYAEHRFKITDDDFVKEKLSAAEQFLMGTVFQESG